MIRRVSSRAIEALTPARLGTDFRWVMSASWANNLGDGIALAAGPLLIASQTKNPTLVAFATLLQRAPWFLFGLYAGWIADQANRRTMIAVADVSRAVVLGMLVLTIATGQVNVPMVLVAMFLLGTAETFADTAAGALLPMIVPSRELGIANARMSFGRKSMNELIGPPIGAALFVIGVAVPFFVQAVLVSLSALLITQIASGRPAAVTATNSPRADIVAGAKWLWRHPALRTLTLTVVLFNLTFGAAWPMLVLYSEERLGMDEVGFGLLLSAGAVGGVCGAMAYGWLEARVSLGNLMRAGLIVETLVHLGLALSTAPWLSMFILFSFGFQATIWGTTATAVRQRAVPEDLQGRVGGVYLVGVFGGLVLGNAIGAVISGIWGVLAPFWFGFVGSAIMLSFIWRQLPHIAHADTPTDSL